MSAAKVLPTTMPKINPKTVQEHLRSLTCSVRDGARVVCGEELERELLGRKKDEKGAAVGAPENERR